MIEKLKFNNGSIIKKGKGKTVKGFDQEQSESKLKTLKDLELVQEIYKTNDSPYPDAIRIKNLRQEVIKWIKNIKTRPEVVLWIKHFFNITEEDLK